MLRRSTRKKRSDPSDNNQKTLDIFKDIDNKPSIHSKPKSKFDFIFASESTLARKIFQIAKNNQEFLSYDAIKTIAKEEKPLPEAKNDEEIVKRVDLVELFTEAKTLAFEYNVSKALQVIGPLGKLAAGIMEVARPDEPDPLMDEMEKVGNTLKTLNDRMTGEFHGLKGFFIEDKLFENYFYRAHDLMELMRECLTATNRRPKERFLKAYNVRNPEEIVREMVGKLSLKGEEWMEMMMKAEELPTREKFEKIVEMIKNCILKLLIVESFAVGLRESSLINSSDDYNKDDYCQITGKYVWFLILADEWKSEFLTNNESYWEKLKASVRNIQNSGRHMKFEDMANEIKDKIDSILTNHNFYVFVFPKEESFYAIKVIDDKMVFISIEPNCKYNVIITRQRVHQKQKTLEFHEKMNEVKVTKYEHLILYLWKYHVEKHLERDVKKHATENFRGCSFFLAFADKKRVAVRMTHNNGADKGPGFITWDAQMTIKALFADNENFIDQIYVVGE